MSGVAADGIGEFGGGRIAGAIGKRLAGRAVLAPLGPLGWAIGGALLAYDAYELYKLYNKSQEEAEDKDTKTCTEDCDKLPDNPDDLVKKGWKETSHPSAKAAGRRTFQNPETGEEIIFDQGKPGQPGWEGRDHYHRPNPNSTGKRDQYLDKNGDPTPRGSGPSHIPPGTRLGRGGASS